MTASLTCPSCGEANSTDMAFCIFCGTPLKSAAPAGHSTAAAIPPMVGQPTGARQMGPAPTPTGMGAGVRTCTNCGQADSLSGIFCVFCGARMDGPTPVVAPGASSLGHPMTAIPEPAVADQRMARARTVGAVMCVLAGLIGAALGGGMAYWYNHDAAPTKQKRDLPAHGLVILTAAPFASFKLVNDGRRFVTGKTGRDGDITIENVEPGEYSLELKSQDGRTEETKVSVKPGEPTVLGADHELLAD